MAYITQKPNIESSGAFAALAGLLGSTFKTIDKLWISEGEANARIRKVHMLNAKSDEELAMMDLNREDIISFVFRDYTEN